MDFVIRRHKIKGYVIVRKTSKRKERSTGKMKKEISDVLKQAVVRLAKKTACVEANSTCGIISYQPKESKKIKLLRKF